MGLEDREYLRDEARRYSGYPMGASGWSMVTTLVVINVGLFVLDSFTSTVGDPDVTRRLNYWLGIKQSQPWAVWTYLTHGFAHASYDQHLWHIIGNMVTLFFLGRPVEVKLGRNEFLRFYLISILVSGLGFTLLHAILPGAGFSYIVGASGAVSAVVALFVFMYPRETILLMGVFPLPAWLLGVLMLAGNFLEAFKPGSHIAWEAHLLGAAFGALYFWQRWNFDRLSFVGGGISNLFHRKPKLKVHDPGRIDPKLQEQAEEILKKISREGEASLSSRERRTMNRYSEAIRKNRN